MMIYVSIAKAQKGDRVVRDRNLEEATLEGQEELRRYILKNASGMHRRVLYEYNQGSCVQPLCTCSQPTQPLAPRLDHKYLSMVAQLTSL